MKVLVLGAKGMAGHVVATYLSGKGYDVIRHDRTIVDALNEEAFAEYIYEQESDIIINCIGILNAKCDKAPDEAVYINSYLPHRLSYLANKNKVIHISTDCVFSGLHAPYYESSMPDGKSLYARTKALGELNNDKDLTFRTSIIGPELKYGIGLFNWFVQQTEASGYSNAIWNGITTIKLAQAIEEAIKQDLTGLYHLVPERNISKYELLYLINERFLLYINLSNDTPEEPNDKTLTNTRRDFNFKIPDYMKLIDEMALWMQDRPVLYEHYAQINKAFRW